MMNKIRHQVISRADGKYANPLAAAARLLVALGMALSIAGVAASTGCAVRQPPGLGKLSRVVDPQSRRAYWLYLPVGLADRSDDEPRAATRRPLVVTFHGMKPFDCANAQAREWQVEADRYGFIVLAPELSSPAMLRQFPVRGIDAAFESDEQAVLRILDHVFATVPADPRRVLSTSWSSGGYLAHYMLNRHPDRFSCLAVRQSNFSPDVLDATRAAESRRHPVLIVGAENDFGVCRREFDQALSWYRKQAYASFSWAVLKGLGHERTPDVAADFFARVTGTRPATAPSPLARRQTSAGEFSLPAEADRRRSTQRRRLESVNHRFIVFDERGASP